MNFKVILALSVLSLALTVSSSSSSSNTAFALDVGAAEIMGTDMIFYADHASVGAIYLDEILDTLVVELDADDAGTLEISIPRTIVDSKSLDADDQYTIIMDGIPTTYDEVGTDSTYRDLSIGFPKGSHTIQIIGTQSLVGSSSSSASELIAPEWVRNAALWWGSGLISDDEFADALTYLIESGILIIN